MYLKKVLNQPTVVGTVMITLLFGAGFVYAFAFDGFNVETVPSGEVDAWIAETGGVSSGGGYTCDSDACKGNGNPGEQYANCPARGSGATDNCTGCSRVTTYCKPKCSKGHHGTCRDTGGCPYAPNRGGCSNAINSKTGKTQTTCPKKKCKGGK